MCGIAGYYSKNPHHSLYNSLEKAVSVLNKRGPDLQKAELLSESVGFAHARLSIIDTSAIANQPMHSADGRYTIVFNGEIFNFKELRETFLREIEFVSGSDTEVLLQLYIKMGADCLRHLNGFFAFAVYDAREKTILLARDRYGIKPLLLYRNGDVVLFGSELKALLQFAVKREIDYTQLALYLQLNYIPGNACILKNFSKLPPGHYAKIDGQGNFEQQRYYSVPYEPGKKIEAAGLSYDEALVKLNGLIHDAVEKRLVADVPLGAFLSGGIDSSIITACAAGKVNGLNTFSIGYKDEPYFDETQYAKLVADRYKTNHTVFSVSNEDMLNCISNVLDYIDEPFADSSSIAVYLLSQKTRSKVTVALSGDGGDELFAGYNKHKAEQRARRKTFQNTLVGAAGPVLRMLPKSRHSAMGNFFRQVQRFSEGVQMKNAERYWRWCSLSTRENALKLLADGCGMEKDVTAAQERLVGFLNKDGDLNDVLFADMQMVLPNDMLTKVDLMSMANSLEVRVPLLDYRVVDFAFSLPVEFKLGGGESKRILKDAFRKDLPVELFNRPKRGFEVPLLKWLKNDLWGLIDEDLLESSFVAQQEIFNPLAVEQLKQKLKSTNPEDSHATMWALVVFQSWYKKYMC